MKNNELIEDAIASVNENIKHLRNRFDTLDPNRGSLSLELKLRDLFNQTLELLTNPNISSEDKQTIICWLPAPYLVLLNINCTKKGKKQND